MGRCGSKGVYKGWVEVGERGGMERRRRKRIQVKHTVGRGGWGGRGGGYEAEKIETVCGESGKKKNTTCARYDGQGEGSK